MINMNMILAMDFFPYIEKKDSMLKVFITFKLGKDNDLN